MITLAVFQRLAPVVAAPNICCFTETAAPPLFSQSGRRQCAHCVVAAGLRPDPDGAVANPDDAPPAPPQCRGDGHDGGLDGHDRGGVLPDRCVAVSVHSCAVGHLSQAACAARQRVRRDACLGPASRYGCTCSCATTIPNAGTALRRAGADISYAQVEKSPGRIALGVFEGTGIFSFAIANVLLPEVPSGIQAHVRLDLGALKGAGSSVHFIAVTRSSARQCEGLSSCADPVGGQASSGIKWPEGLQRGAPVHQPFIRAGLHLRILGAVSIPL